MKGGEEMPERRMPLESNNGQITDPIKQRVEEAVQNGDEMAMARINYLMRTNPFADLPGETPTQDGIDQASIERMISEGSPGTKAD